MSKYKVWLVTEKGEGHVQELQDWDGEDQLTLYCAAFAKDAVIQIEPNTEVEKCGDCGTAGRHDCGPRGVGA